MLGPISMTFVALENGLKLYRIFRVILGSPQILRPSWLGVNCSSVGPGNNNSRIPEADSRDPETEIGSPETEKRVHRMHGSLETGLQMIPRSLVAPTGGAGGFHELIIY